MSKLYFVNDVSGNREPVAFGSFQSLMKYILETYHPKNKDRLDKMTDVAFIREISAWGLEASIVKFIP